MGGLLGGGFYCGERFEQPAVVLEREPEAGQLIGARCQPGSIGLIKLDDFRNQHDLAGDAGHFDRRLHSLIDDALMRGMLIDDDEPVAGLRHDIGLVDLRARSTQRPPDLLGRRLKTFNPRIGRRRAEAPR